MKIFKVVLFYLFLLNYVIFLCKSGLKLITTVFYVWAEVVCTCINIFYNDSKNNNVALTKKLYKNNSKIGCGALSKLGRLAVFWLNADKLLNACKLTDKIFLKCFLTFSQYLWAFCWISTIYMQRMSNILVRTAYALGCGNVVGTHDKPVTAAKQ